MFRTATLIATCLAVITWRTAAIAGPNENATSIAASARANDQEVAEITTRLPFTHIAYIPEGADISSIRIEGVKALKVPTERRAVTNPRYCDQSWPDPGGSMYCPLTTNESPVPAYRVTYSFQGRPMASDEYGNTRFSFSVYFRANELGPEIRQALSSGAVGKAAASEFFDVTTYKDSIGQVAIDQANSIFCGGNYVDGNWTRKNPTCLDRVAYTEVVSASSFTTVKIAPVVLRLETAAARIPSRQKSAGETACPTQ